jgi:cbb3-type cytochrome oxidase subunit 1
VHSIVRRFIKTAFGFLLAGFALGGWMMVQREVYGSFPGRYQVSAHTHAILVGFVIMMILGVALWLFPRPDKSDVRYRPVLVELAYWLITVGTAARLVGEVARQTIDAAWLRWAVLAAGFAQIAAVLVFFYTMWSRIRAAGSQVREAKGERF